MTSILPPCSATIRRTIARPRALPGSTLASTTFAAHEVPREVWAQLTETIGPPEGTELVFVDAQGRTSPVVVPKTE